MKKRYIFFGLIFLFGSTANAQLVKKAEKDTVKAGRANDRLKNAGPVDGWPTGNKPDSAQKIKAAPVSDTARRKGSRSK